MTVVRAAALLSMVALTVVAEDVTLTDGRVLKNAQLQRAEPHQVTLVHSKGAETVPFAKLKPEDKVKFGYDEDKEREYLRKQDEAANQATNAPAQAATNSLLVFAGLQLGMHIDKAHAVLKKIAPNIVKKQTKDGMVLVIDSQNPFAVPWTVAEAGKSLRVSAFSFPPEVTDGLFNVADIRGKEFADLFFKEHGLTLGTTTSTKDNALRWYSVLQSGDYVLRISSKKHFIIKKLPKPNL